MFVAQKSIGMKHMASEKENSRSNGSSTSRSSRQRALNAQKSKFVICIDTGGNVDLELRKVYRVKADKNSAREGLVRVIDNSGEDYLYPVEYFVTVRVPPKAAKLVRELA